MDMDARISLSTGSPGEETKPVQRYGQERRKSARDVSKVDARGASMPPLGCKDVMVTDDKSQSKSDPRLDAPREIRLLYTMEEEAGATINLGAAASNHEHDSLLEIEAKKLNIPTKTINILRGLREYQLLFIIDDGNSMTFDSRFSYRKDGAKQLNCMEELKLRFKIMIPLIAALSDSGVIIKTVNERVEVFIDGGENNEDKKNNMYDAIERMKARGNTPLITVLEKSFKSAFDRNIKTIAYVMTGEVLTCEHPSQSPYHTIIDLLESFRQRADESFFPINLMPCTCNAKDVGWMDGIDQYIKNIHITDDYFSEAKKVYNAHGYCVNYTYGLHTAVSLAAPINDLLDHLDSNTGSKCLTVGQLETLNGSLISPSEYAKYKNEANKARDKAGSYNYAVRKLHPVNETKTLKLNGMTLYRVGIIEDYYNPFNRPDIPDRFLDCECSIL